MESTKKIKALMSNIIKKEVWDFRLSESTGSIISFECGLKIQKKGLGKLNIEYEGESSFMIYCPWRIVKSNKIITSWNEGPLLLKKGVDNLEKLKIIHIQISNYFDISIKFENEFYFELFCDKGINDDFDCNWFFRENETYYSVNNNCELETELLN